MKKRALCLNCGKYVKYTVEQAFETMRTETGNITYKRIIPKCRKCGEELYISKIDEANLTRLDREYKKFNEDKVKYITDKDKEIARLTAENDKLRARLDNAVELPCKVGDIIYVRYYNRKTKQHYLKEEKVSKTNYTIADGHLSGIVYAYDFSSRHETDNCYIMRDYNKTWFNDRIKAEEKLKELQGGGENESK